MSLPPGSISEICYVTSDLEKTVAKWAATVGAGPFYEFPCPTENLLLRGEIIADRFRAALGFMGTTVIEILEPNGPAHSIFTQVLAENGEGAVHHIYPNMQPLTTDEFNRICDDYSAQGLERVMDFTVPGMGRNAFFDAREQVGSYIEIVESGPIAQRFTDAMYDAHVKGLEGRPLRPISEILSMLDLSEVNS